MSQRKHNYEDWIWSMRVLAAGAARRGRTLIVFLAGAAIFALGLVVTFGLVSGLASCAISPHGALPDASATPPNCADVGCPDTEDLYCNRPSTDPDGERETTCGCPQADGKIERCYRRLPPAADAGVDAGAADANGIRDPRIDAS